MKNEYQHCHNYAPTMKFRKDLKLRYTWDSNVPRTFIELRSNPIEIKEDEVGRGFNVIDYGILETNEMYTIAEEICINFEI